MGSRVTVVGSGPAAIAVASQLLSTGHSVEMIPGGGYESTPHSLDRSKGAVGKFGWLHPLENFRSFTVGGAGNLWGGRLVSLDSIDFEQRAWVANSGWPIGFAEYRKWVSLACEFLRVPDLTSSEDSDKLSGADAEKHFVSPGKFEFWSPLTNFQDFFRENLASKPNFVFHTDAVLTGFRTSSNGVVTHLDIDSNGSRRQLDVHRVVLAMGTLETTRILLNSDLAPRLPALGRYFMVHTSTHTEAITKGRFSDVVDFKLRAGIYTRRRWVAPGAKQKKELVGNCSAYITLPARGGEDPLIRAQSWLRDLSATRSEGSGRRSLATVIGSVREGVDIFHSLGLRRLLGNSIVGSALRGRRRAPLLVPSHSSPPWSLQLHGEHFPNRDSYVSLSEQTDCLGLPRLESHLQFSEADQSNLDFWRNYLSRKLALKGFAIGGPSPHRTTDFEAKISYSPAHQAGTTRMGLNSMTSVVNENLRVHGTRNLYVASGGVFPTFGHANPTLTLIALALRLAKHLSDEN